MGFTKTHPYNNGFWWKKLSLHFVSSFLFAGFSYRNRKADVWIAQVELKCAAPELYRHLTFIIQVPEQPSFSIYLKKVLV